jgi:hypothetical protein
MHYFITRGEQQYGPYSLAQLQSYVQQGNIALTDLTRSEGMTEWVPVSQVIGNIVVTTPAQNAFGMPIQMEQQPPAVVLPSPPSLHWSVTLLLGIVTCSFFGIIWIFVQAVWIKKVRPATIALPFLIAHLVVALAGGFLSVAIKSPEIELLARIVSLILYQMGSFRMRDAIEDYCNIEEKMNLRLSGVMTFFFSVYYFQYHLTQIRKLKQTAGSLDMSY